MFQKGVAIAVVLATAALAGAQSPATQPSATQPDSDRIAALIAQMGVPRFQDRKEAQRALVAIGPPAEPALRDAIAHSPNAEIRARAKSALDKIEDNIPDAPTRVSISATGLNPGVVCRSLGDQSGVPIYAQNQYMWSGRAGQVVPITLNLDRVPFLVGLEQFCKASGTYPMCNNSPWRRGIQLMMGNRGVWDQEDRMAAVAMSIGHNREYNLADRTENRADFIEMGFFFDPRRRMVNFQPPKLTVAQDENGASFLAGSSNETPQFGFNPFMSRYGFQSNASLSYPAHAGKTLARVEGTLLVRVAAQVETLNIPDLAKAVGGPAVIAGNRKVEVLGFDPAATLHVRITNLGPPKRRTPDDPWDDLGNEFRSAEVVDATGMVLPMNGGGGGDTTIDWNGSFLTRGQWHAKPPVSLRWEIVTQTRDITMPFKFKDLPLPPE